MEYNQISLLNRSQRRDTALGEQVSPDSETLRVLNRAHERGIVLEKGSRGEAVRALQQQLNHEKSGGKFTVVSKHDKELIRLGLVVTNGVYDEQTEKRVREFQGSASITVDGDSGPITIGKLLSSQPSAQAQNRSIDTAANLPKPIGSGISLNPTIPPLPLPHTRESQLSASLPSRSSARPDGKSDLSIAKMDKYEFMSSDNIKAVVFNRYGKDTQTALKNPNSDYRKYLENEASGPLKDAYESYLKRSEQSRDAGRKVSKSRRPEPLNFRADGKSGPADELVTGYMQFSEAKTSTVDGRAIQVDGDLKSDQTRTLAASAKQHQALLDAELAQAQIKQYGKYRGVFPSGDLQSTEISPRSLQEKALEIDRISAARLNAALSDPSINLKGATVVHVALDTPTKGYAPKYHGVKVDGFVMDPFAADAYIRMKAAADEDGIKLSPYSAFRTFPEQQQCRDRYIQQLNSYNEKLAAYNENPSDFNAKPKEPAEAVPAGCSRHNGGMSIDFKNTKGAYAWLKKRGPEFDWDGISSEDWHHDFDRDKSPYTTVLRRDTMGTATVASTTQTRKKS